MKDNDIKSNQNIDEEQESRISREDFAGLMDRLGDDAMRELLLASGSDTDISEGSAADDATEAPSAEDPGSTDDKTTSSKTRKRPADRKRIPIIAIVVLLLLTIAAANGIFQRARINTNDKIEYADADKADDIRISDGLLAVNDIEVSVPADGTEEYNISYSWAAEDTEYPSVPHAATVTYRDKEGSRKYDISLYRNETVGPKSNPDGKTAKNWFRDWNTGNGTEDGSGIVQRPLDTKSVSGFYIYPGSTSDGALSDYGSFTYYFAEQSGDAVKIYILEGVCQDSEHASELSEVMKDCIKSIRIKKPEKRSA